MKSPPNIYVCQLNHVKQPLPLHSSNVIIKTITSNCDNYVQVVDLIKTQCLLLANNRNEMIDIITMVNYKS